MSVIMFVEIPASFSLGLIYLTVNIIVSQQLLMGAKTVYPAFLQHNDTVRMLHRRYTLGDNKLCGTRNLFSESLTDSGVRGSVHRTGGIVQYKYFRFF